MKKIILIVFILFAALLMSSVLFFNHAEGDVPAPTVAPAVASEPVSTPEIAPQEAEETAEPSPAPAAEVQEPVSTFEPIEIVDEYVVDLGEEDSDNLQGALG